MPAGPLPARNRSPSAPTTPARRQPPERLEALLRDLGPQLQAGKALQETRQPRDQAIRHASGIEGIDELLEGGFPRGELGEITGPACSGRTSLGFALLARTTDDKGRPRELAAVIDTTDTFDPLSAQAAGVDLCRVLWARVGTTWRDAMRCTERLLETEGLPLVILDLAPGAAPRARAPNQPEIPASAWTRLARRAAATRTALVVLSDHRRTGTEARMVVELRPTRAHFSGSPSLLEEIETRAVLVRHRGGVSGQSARVRLGAPRLATGPPG